MLALYCPIILMWNMDCTKVKSVQYCTAITRLDKLHRNLLIRILAPCSKLLKSKIYGGEYNKLVESAIYWSSRIYWWRVRCDYRDRKRAVIENFGRPQPPSSFTTFLKPSINGLSHFSFWRCENIHNLLLRSQPSWKPSRKGLSRFSFWRCENTHNLLLWSQPS